MPPPARGAQAALSKLDKAAITTCVILATVMQALDTTIANVALPYIQGSVSASQDQIEWVLTSYIVAAAIMTPTTGFLAGRFGVKRLFLAAVAGFVAASMLCGLAQSLDQIVIFRVLQGMFGAALVPLAQTTLLNINSPAQQGSAMAVWGVAVMAGPVLGPVLGGWLTQTYSWRFVFYINLPIGLLAFLGMRAFMADTAGNKSEKLDWFGFGMLSLGIGAMQVMLDRGEEQDWFGSQEIILEAVIAACAFYLFLVHTFTSREPFVRPALFKDRNFAAGMLLIGTVGLTYFASMALQPLYLQNLMNYPVVTAGMTMGPRGLGTMAAMLLVGRLIGRADIRALLATGLTITTYTFWTMSHWTPDVAQSTIIVTGVIQGMGLGFIFVPLSVATLATLSSTQRAEGAGLYSLSRNIGSSIGISVANSLLTQNTEINHATISRSVTAVNRQLADPMIARFWDPATAAGRTALDAVITRQARIIAYIDDYRLLMIATLAVFPLLLVFKSRPAGATTSDHAIVVE
jgi:DHA2 family multidrug resistance protein